MHILLLKISSGSTFISITDCFAFPVYVSDDAASEGADSKEVAFEVIASPVVSVYVASSGVQDSTDSSVSFIIYYATTPSTGSL